MVQCYVCFYSACLLIILLHTNYYLLIASEQFSTVRVRIAEEGLHFFSKIAHHIVRLSFIYNLSYFTFFSLTIKIRVIICN